MTIQYLAGIIDGEGHFYRPARKARNGKSYTTARIVVVNTCSPLIEALIDQFGGTVSVVSQKGTLGRMRCYRWVLEGKKAEALGRRLKPYLIVKAQQVLRIL